MTILWLCSWYPTKKDPVNGDFIQRHARAVALFHDVTVIHLEQSGSKIFSQSSINDERHGRLREIVISMDWKGGPASKLWYNLQYFQTYSKFLQLYFKQNGLPDFVHVHVPMKAGRVAQWIKRRYGTPFLVSDHSSAYLDSHLDAFSRRSFYFRYSVRRIFRQASAVTMVSRLIAKRVEDMFALHEVKVIHNVIDERHFNFAPPPPQPFRFLHASNFAHAKNMEGLLRSLAILNKKRIDWQCVIVGGPDETLQQLSSELGLEDRIIWKGWLAYEEVAREMKAAHALLLFSRYENFPCVLIEALACGRPVIATRVGGIPEAIDPSNGILVEDGDEAAMARAMEVMMDGYDRYDAASISKEAVARYNYRAIGAQFSALYQSLLPQQRSKKG